jgi:hypothetical protein
MDLKDFVADVISQIRDGVTEAILRHDRQGAVGRINPVFPTDDGRPDWKGAVQNIEFDIAITASDKTGREGGGGVQVYFFNVSGKQSKSQENSMTNRIKFTIPVSLPAHAVSSGTEPQDAGSKGDR